MPYLFISGTCLRDYSCFQVGHYPWFATYNLLSEKLPAQDGLWSNLGRSAAIGFCSSFVSDVSSNSIRVVKTTKQSSATSLTYPAAVQMVVAKDGVSGLFLRGLGTRVIANGCQGMMFTIVFKGLQKKWAESEEKAE